MKSELWEASLNRCHVLSSMTSQYFNSNSPNSLIFFQLLLKTHIPNSKKAKHPPKRTLFCQPQSASFAPLRAGSSGSGTSRVAPRTSQLPGAPAEGLEVLAPRPPCTRRQMGGKRWGFTAAVDFFVGGFFKNIKWGVDERSIEKNRIDKGRNVHHFLKFFVDLHPAARSRRPDAPRQPAEGRERRGGRLAPPGQRGSGAGGWTGMGWVCYSPSGSNRPKLFLWLISPLKKMFFLVRKLRD